MFHSLALIVAISLATSVQQTPAAATFQLAAVQVTGAKRYSVEDVTRLSGLIVGKPVTVADLPPAADRLASTGLFAQLQYRYVMAGRQMTVIFEFAEADWTVPVTFDNFVWFSDDEIIAAVRREVPSFDGTVPATEGVPALMIGALQQLLEHRGIPGTAGILPQTDMAKTSLRYLFRVTDPAPKLCAMSVNGASTERQRDLLEATRPMVGTDYSRFYLKGIAGGTLLDIYHRHGHWRAAFGPPMTKLAAAECHGVSVALEVNEGPVYTWAGAQWSGNAAIPATDLDRLLAMRTGDVADDSKIRGGLLRVSKAYGRIGHLRATANASPRLDEDGQRAVFEMTVSEGPQFRMGTVQFIGMPEADAARLTKAWKLAPDAIYDAGYPNDFQVKEIFSRRRQGAKVPVMQLELDRTRHVINVRFVVE